MEEDIGSTDKNKNSDRNGENSDRKPKNSNRNPKNSDRKLKNSDRNRKSTDRTRPAFRQQRNACLVFEETFACSEGLFHSNHLNLAFEQMVCTEHR